MAWLLMLFSYAFLFLTPVALLTWFIVSLIRYIRARKMPQGPTKSMKIQLILSAVLFGLVVVALLLLIAVFAMAIAFM